MVRYDQPRRNADIHAPTPGTFNTQRVRTSSISLASQTGIRVFSKRSRSPKAWDTVPRGVLQCLESTELVRCERLQWHDQHRPGPEQPFYVWQSPGQGRRLERFGRTQPATLPVPLLLGPAESSPRRPGVRMGSVAQYLVTANLSRAGQRFSFCNASCYLRPLRRELSCPSIK